MSLFLLCAAITSQAQQTETMMLSGTGSDHTVDWQFYCTAGRNSGKWSTIPVPSNWELQGFGKYNYGHDKDSVRGKEQGLYKHAFTVPAVWKGKTVNIVFEGSMTDTEVKINGKLAGAIHQGSFYCFKYDISSLLKYGKKNLLEVTVSKHSANESVNGAERRGDFWIFGGIFRPVYLQAMPAAHINRVAVNGKANGAFTAQVHLSGVQADAVRAQIFTMDGKETGATVTANIKAGDSIATVQTQIVSPKTWSPEFPNRYKVQLSLLKNGAVVHTVQEKFGFRTVELRERDGIYLNGVKIKFKGVCRHSFWPSTGRTLNEQISVQDVLTMKDMNMNAVRMSHYPPDDHFLDACDSLGLMVLDELAGWHKAYDTQVGTTLVQEMVHFDGNHPSIVLWDNGNEGGHNFDLDAVFDAADIQQRPVIHPWQSFRGTDTQHYINFDYGNGVSLHSHEIAFPTEFLHGLYDGGLGAGLEEYWEYMWHHPLSAGGFLWVFADEGVVRTDKNGVLDTDGNHAPDGIMGPYHEKEGSYYTIKEVWAPVYFEHREITDAFDGRFRIENRYHFTNLNQCSFSWKLAQMPIPGSAAHPLFQTGNATAPDMEPLTSGTLALNLPANWKQFDVLYITVHDPHGKELYTWSWPITRPAAMAEKIVPKTGGGTVEVKEQDSLLIITAGNTTVTFHKNNGRLLKAEHAKGVIPIGHGPVLSERDSAFTTMRYRKENNTVIIESDLVRKSTFQSLKWTIYPSGWVQMQANYFPSAYEFSLAGINFSFPENQVKEIRWLGNGPYRVWKNRMKGTTLHTWKKVYNNTATGEGKLVYPEFKGYYSGFYWMQLITNGQPLTVVCGNEDVYLRLFTPQFSSTPFNTAPAFPAGDISFMHAITPIGTKSQKPEGTGPAGQKSMFYDFSKDPYYAKKMTLYFDFSGK
jgi:hypothetical protein